MKEQQLEHRRKEWEKNKNPVPICIYITQTQLKMKTVKIVTTGLPEFAEEQIQKFLNDGFVLSHFQYNDGYSKYHMVFIKEEKPVKEEIPETPKKENFWFTQLWNK